MAEENEIGFSGAGAITQIISAESDMQIATAKRYPRDLERFKKNVELQVTADIDTAMSMGYKLEREDKETGEKKDIIGPSVRFAEVCALAWGNLRVGTRIIDIDENFVTVQGTAWDLESNFAQMRERKGSIRTKKGFKYSQDMIKNVANAQASTAYREAILKTIPQAFWKPLFDKAQNSIAEAKGEHLSRARDRVLKYLTGHKEGVALDVILAKLGRSKPDEITGEDMVLLGSIANATRDGETTPRKAFAEPEAPDAEESAQGAKQADLLNQMKGKEAASSTAKTQPPVN